MSDDNGSAKRARTEGSLAPEDDRDGGPSPGAYRIATPNHRKVPQTSKVTPITNSDPLPMPSSPSSLQETALPDSFTELPDSEEIVSLKEAEQKLEDSAKRLEALCSTAKVVYEKKLKDSLRNMAPYPSRKVATLSGRSWPWLLRFQGKRER